MPVVATPEATGETASQWSGLLHSVLAKLGVNEEQQDGVIENIAGEMASEEGESGKRTVREVGQEMELRGEMVRDAEKRMLERSSEMITGVGEMMDVDESRDERNVGITGEDGEMAAVGEHAAHERAVDMVEDIHDMANTEHADSSTMEKRWFDDENAHTLGGNQQTSANMRTDLKTSTEISVRADTAIQKQGIDLDMENGGLEVRGQMGGLKGSWDCRLCERNETKLMLCSNPC